MAFELKDNKIALDKELNKLDRFVIDFVKALKPVKYVIVSGYVSILFGRTRTTENIDILIENLTFEQFRELLKRLKKAKFSCINVDDEKELFDLLKNGHSIRFAEAGRIIPNMELKFAREKEDIVSIAKPLLVKLKKTEIYVSPLELQIAYKLRLGSEKDIEDARHLYQLFKNDLNKEVIKGYARYMGVLDLLKELGD